MNLLLRLPTGWKLEKKGILLPAETPKHTCLTYFNVQGGGSVEKEKSFYHFASIYYCRYNGFFYIEKYLNKSKIVIEKNETEKS